MVCFDVAHRFRKPTLPRELNNRENGSNTRSENEESEWINGKIGKQQIEYKLFRVRQTFQDAKETCAALSGFLPEVEFYIILTQNGYQK